MRRNQEPGTRKQEKWKVKSFFRWNLEPRTLNVELWTSNFELWTLNLETENERDMEKSKIMDMDSYIAACPVEIQKTLQKLRKTIQISAPDATEKMSYAMPTFYLNGNLVHFAAYKNHIGFYPAPSGIEGAG